MPIPAPLAHPWFTPNPSPAARRLLWHVFSVGCHVVEKPVSNEALDKPGVQIMMIERGRGWLQLPQCRLPLAPGTLLAYQFHRRRFIPEPDDALYLDGIRFSGPGVDAWIEALDIDNRPFLAAEHLPVIRSTTRTVWRLSKQASAGWEMRVHEILSRLMLRLTRPHLLPAKEKATRLPEEVRRVLDAVASDPARDWLARELSDVAGVSYSKLRDMFQQSLNRTLHGHLQSVRADQAKAMLADRAVSVKEVARRLNFSSEHYFSRFFRRSTGLTPTQFRLAR